jgi:outer membrane lipoprotein-sorting protein
MASNRFLAIRERRYFAFLTAIVAPIVLLPVRASAQAPAGIEADRQLTLSQVVEKLVQKNAERAKALESYRGKRTYKIDYKGFPSAFRAEMVVEMTYTAPATKDFKILSESGSKWIVKRVLKRLIDGEKEAQEAATRKSVELNTQNYNFTSLERQTDAGGCGYVLAIQPKVPNKFLYRGRIWVNDQDFAVCRIEAEPSKNPSIWITKTEIRHNYQKFEDFWLPVENQSISSLRLGGHATLTITYQEYEINTVHPAKDNSASAGQ